MQASLFTADSNINYSIKEPGPIILALAFVIAVGGVAAAAVVACGWGNVKSAGINWAHHAAEIVCK